MKSCIPALTLLGLALAAAPAGADVDADKEARAQFKLGTQLFHEGEYEQAAIAFERANELKPSYKILYNIAQVEAELKHYTRALEAYIRYLEEGGAKVGRTRRAEVEEKMERLRSLVGSIAITSNAEGAIVMVDGVRRGEVPLPGPIPVDGIHPESCKISRTRAAAACSAVRRVRPVFSARVPSSVSRQATKNRLA